MYQRILVPVENSPYDEVILTHIRKLARTCNDASIVLIHVADGWAARNINQLDLRESEEMRYFTNRALLEVGRHWDLADPACEVRFSSSMTEPYGACTVLDDIAVLRARA